MEQTARCITWWTWDWRLKSRWLRLLRLLHKPPCGSRRAKVPFLNHAICSRNDCHISWRWFAPISTHVFTARDIEKETYRLKINRADVVDQLQFELLKHVGEPLAKTIHWVISKISEKQCLTEEWMAGTVCPVYRKGDKLDCCNK